MPSQSLQSQSQSQSLSIGLLPFRSIPSPSAPVPIPTGTNVNISVNVNTSNSASTSAAASAASSATGSVSNSGLALPLAFGSSTISPSTSPQLLSKQSVHSVHGSSAGAPSAVAVSGPVPKLAWCWANGFLYSAHFTDDLYEYRLVQLPVQMAPVLCQLFANSNAPDTYTSAVQFPTASKLKSNQTANTPGAGANSGPGCCIERLLAEHEWRGIGIQQSVGWQHCAWWPLNGQPLSNHNHNHKLTLLFRRPRAPLLQLPRAVCHAQATQMASQTQTQTQPQPQPQPQPQSQAQSQPTLLASSPSESSAISSVASAPGSGSAVSSAELSLVPGVYQSNAVAVSEQQQLRSQLHALAHPNRHRMCVSSKRNLIPAPSAKLIATK